MKRTTKTLAAAITAVAMLPLSVKSSSHMDAPLITLDPAANTADVYAFVSTQNAVKYLTVALAVYPHEEPGVGPNKYNFDDNVLYRIHVATGANLPTQANPSPRSSPTATYEFSFSTTYKNTGTIAQSYLGVIGTVDDASQNLTQRYTVQKVTPGNKRDNVVTIFNNGVVPPNNQGLVTPQYNQGEDGDNLAKEGVDSSANLDAYTSATIFSNALGYQVFAGQRDDGFYADIQSIFDLDFSFGGPGSTNKPFDSQGGFNVHTIVLNIPVSDIGGDQQIAGVWATTARRTTQVIREDGGTRGNSRTWSQVGRQGNPLFCEGLVGIVDKDRYNRGSITNDLSRFNKYALKPELAALIGAAPDRQDNRTDISGIFIPDLIKVDLSTDAAHLAGGSNPGAVPDDTDFHRLSIFGDDVLTSNIQEGFGGGTIPGGWPNGRRFGDDVVDIAVLALLSDLRTSPPMIVGDASSDVDKVTTNDIGYNKVFPYAATPLNGRNHTHDRPIAP